MVTVPGVVVGVAGMYTMRILFHRHFENPCARFASQVKDTLLPGIKAPADSVNAPAVPDTTVVNTSVLQIRAP